MQKTRRESGRNFIVRYIKPRIEPRPLSDLRKVPSQEITGVLLHPLTQIVIGMFMAIMIDCGKDMMNFESMPKGNRGHEHQSQGKGQANKECRCNGKFRSAHDDYLCAKASKEVFGCQ